MRSKAYAHSNRIDKLVLDLVIIVGMVKSSIMNYQISPGNSHIKYGTRMVLLDGGENQVTGYSIHSGFISKPIPVLQQSEHATSEYNEAAVQYPVYGPGGNPFPDFPVYLENDRLSHVFTNANRNETSTRHGYAYPDRVLFSSTSNLFTSQQCQNQLIPDGVNNHETSVTSDYTPRNPVRSCGYNINLSDKNVTDSVIGILLGIRISSKINYVREYYNNLHFSTGSDGSKSFLIIDPIGNYNVGCDVVNPRLLHENILRQVCEPILPSVRYLSIYGVEIKFGEYYLRMSYLKKIFENQTAADPQSFEKNARDSFIRMCFNAYTAILRCNYLTEGLSMVLCNIKAKRFRTPSNRINSCIREIIQPEFDNDSGSYELHHAILVNQEITVLEPTYNPVCYPFLLEMFIRNNELHPYSVICENVRDLSENKKIVPLCDKITRNIKDELKSIKKLIFYKIYYQILMTESCSKYLLRYNFSFDKFGFFRSITSRMFWMLYDLEDFNEIFIDSNIAGPERILLRTSGWVLLFPSRRDKINGKIHFISTIAIDKLRSKLKTSFDQMELYIFDYLLDANYFATMISLNTLIRLSNYN